MAKAWGMGDCVRLPDGRIGRVRAKSGRQYRTSSRRIAPGLDQRERSEDTEEIVR